jgi:diaminopimelate decarboxylase
MPEASPVRGTMLWPITTQRRDTGELAIGGIGLAELAREFGTPLYIYDEATMRARARAIREAFTSRYPNTRVVYASKAYAAPAILRIFFEEGLGLDVVSEGELVAGLRAGIPAAEMTLHGNNKSERELEAALRAGIGHIVIDNMDEIELLGGLAASLNQVQPVLLRLNPGVDVHTHHKIATGVNDSKFGFPVWDGSAERAVEAAIAASHLRLDGYHMHIGSQLLDWEGYRLAIEEGFAFAAAMRDRYGVIPAVFSPGGGFGIAYTAAMAEPDLAGWATAAIAAVTASCERFELPQPELIVEPGRTLVGPAGVALYTVGSRKEIAGVRTYISVDGGMADNIRPALYEARYTAEIANRASEGPIERITLAGRYCESGDLLIQDIDLPRLDRGDLLAVPGAGAYSLAMASNYNLSLRPAVVLVQDGAARLIRRRETFDDLFATDVALAEAVK